MWHADARPALHATNAALWRAWPNGHARADGPDVTPAEYQRELLVV